jgi:hypothetical protein
MTNPRSNRRYSAIGSQSSASKITSSDDERFSLLNTAELAWLTDTSKSTWEKMRMRGEGPSYIKVRNLIWYRWADVDAWLSAHEIPTEEIV